MSGRNNVRWATHKQHASPLHSPIFHERQTAVVALQVQDTHRTQPVPTFREEGVDVGRSRDLRSDGTVVVVSWNQTQQFSQWPLSNTHIYTHNNDKPVVLEMLPPAVSQGSNAWWATICLRNIATMWINNSRAPLALITHTCACGAHHWQNRTVWIGRRSFAHAAKIGRVEKQSHFFLSKIITCYHQFILHWFVNQTTQETKKKTILLMVFILFF